MDTLKERQLTVRASRRPIEYNYTNADIHHMNASAHEGYQFEYPVSWTGDQSTQKVIGIRRINYKPASLDIAFTITVHDASGNIEIPVIYVFTEQNTFEEAINRIVADINQILEAKSKDCRCTVRYDKEKGSCIIRFEDIHNSEWCYYTVSFPYGVDDSYDGSDERYNSDYTYYKKEFLKLFNQPITKENVDKLHSNRDKPNLEAINFASDVWNRDSFYCHASFSDSPRRIIGINGDFWPTPSVLYDYTDNSNDFNVYFTTDTVNRILPRNGTLLIQLSYIFNYQTSMLQYA